MSATMAMIPFRASTFATNVTLPAWASRATLPKPRSELSPRRISSPSSSSTFQPRDLRSGTSSRAIVVFPEDGSPVSQMQYPWWVMVVKPGRRSVPGYEGCPVEALREARDRSSLDFRRNRDTHEGEDRGPDVDQVLRGPQYSGANPRSVDHVDAVERMDRVVRPGVVLVQEERVVPDGAGRPPCGIAEVNHEVGGVSPNFAVDLGWSPRVHPERLAIGPPHLLEFTREPRLELSHLRGLEHSLRLASPNVVEDPCVVASGAPSVGLGPVDVRLLERSTRDRSGSLQRQEPLADQPLIDTETSLHRLAAVVGENENPHVIARLGDQAADFLVQHCVVVLDHGTVGRVGLVSRMTFVEVLPESVMDPVRADLVECEEVPPLLGPEVSGHGEMLSGHLDQLRSDPIAVLGPEGHIEFVTAGDALDLVSHRSRVDVVLRAVRSQEIRDVDPIDRGRRIPRRHPDDTDSLPKARKTVPDLRVENGSGRRYVRVPVGARPAVAEPVDAEGPGVHSREHDGPGWNRDGRVDGPQRAVGRPPKEFPKMGHLRKEPVEQ